LQAHAPRALFRWALSCFSRLGACALCATILPLSAGCSTRSGEPIKLVLMSPHRDEIREEFAVGFQEWFRDRSNQRMDAARSALAAWQKKSDPGNTAGVSQAFTDLFFDWREDDLTEVRSQWQAWQRNPAPASADALLVALDDWQKQLLGVEFVWQDIGGGTSQIERYIRARFESHLEGIGIDFLFGGGTDIFLRLADGGLLEPIAMPPSILGGRIP